MHRSASTMRRAAAAANGLGTLCGIFGARTGGQNQVVEESRAREVAEEAAQRRQGARRRGRRIAIAAAARQVAAQVAATQLGEIGPARRPADVLGEKGEEGREIAAVGPQCMR